MKFKKVYTTWNQSLQYVHSLGMMLNFSWIKNAVGHNQQFDFVIKKN